MGKGKGRSGGGGSSGKVGYPEYLESRHRDWLNDMDGFYRSAVASNPYANAESYDPANEVGQMQQAALSFSDAILATEPTASFQTYFAAAEAMVDGWASSTCVDNLAAAYAANQALQLAQAKARYHAGMADINAVMSTAFVVGDAILEAQHQKDLDAFTEGLYVNKEKDKASMINQGVQSMSQLGAAKMSALKDSASMQIEAARIQLVAYNDQYKEDIEYDAKDIMWDIDVLQEAMGTLGAPAGAIPGGAEKGLNAKNSPLQGALSGALSGGSYGAMIGGTPGAMLGAVVGGIGGLFG